MLVAAELAVRDHRAERLDHDAHAKERGDVGRIVRRRDLDHLEAWRTPASGSRPRDPSAPAQQALQFGAVESVLAYPDPLPQQHWYVFVVENFQSS